MGYVFLSLALLAGITKAYCGKRLGNVTSKIEDAVSANLLRMFLCIIIGFVLVLIKGDYTYILPNAQSLFIMGISGIATSVFLISWLLSVNRGVYLLVEVVLMLGVLVPILTSLFWFQERISWGEWVGIVLLVLSAVIICFYNNTQKGKMDFTSLSLLFICGLSSGVIDLTQRLFVKTSPGIPASVFNLYTYVFSAVTLLPILCILAKKTGVSVVGEIRRIAVRSSWTIVVMAFCLFANSYFKTLAAGYLEAAQLYPLNQGLTLILSTLMAAFLFKEKFTLISCLGVLVALLSIIFMNVLKL